jgi:3-mercaptopyruvate sulfurtransferase SseA
MRAFFTAGIMSLAVLLPVACSKVVPLPEYRAYQNDADVPRISVEDTKKDVDAGIAVIVDARDAASYNAQHIAGSITFPLGSTDDKFASLPKDKKIIVYCS